MKEGACKYRLRKNDTVKVISGKEKGKTGKILSIDKAEGRIFIEGLNMVKKAMKKRKQTDKGGIVEIEASIHISNVMIVCKKCGSTRVGFKVNGDEKTRICKKCGEQI